MNKSDWLTSLLSDDHIVTEWFLLNSTHSRHPKTWTMQTIAKTIWNFDYIIIHARSLVSTLRWHNSILMISWRVWERLKSSWSMKLQLFVMVKPENEKKGIYLQDDIKLDNLTYNCFNQDSGASCRQEFLPPFGKNYRKYWDLITNINRVILKEWMIGLNKHYQNRNKGLDQAVKFRNDLCEYA